MDSSSVLLSVISVHVPTVSISSPISDLAISSSRQYSHPISRASILAELFIRSHNMERFILFRSRQIRTRTSGDNILTHRGRGTDYADIVTYTMGDDTRDISWTHSGRTDTLMVKVRTEEDSFPILIIDTIDASHGFSTDTHPQSPYQFTTELTRSIRESAKKHHFPSHIQTDTG